MLTPRSPWTRPYQKCQYWSHSGRLVPNASDIVLYRAAYPPGWSWNFDRYSWTGLPGIRCGMPQSMVAPTKKAST